MRVVEWFEARPVHDCVRFADEDEPGFDRASAWRAALAGMNRLALDEVRVELATRAVDGMGDVPIVRYWTLVDITPPAPTARRLPDPERPQNAPTKEPPHA